MLIMQADNIEDVRKKGRKSFDEGEMFTVNKCEFNFGDGASEGTTSIGGERVPWKKPKMLLGKKFKN